MKLLFIVLISTALVVGIRACYLQAQFDKTVDRFNAYSDSCTKYLFRERNHPLFIHYYKLEKEELLKMDVIMDKTEFK